MSVDVGITGAPGAGRTTVFRALLAHRAPARAGARAAGSAIGAIRVQDPRLEQLAGKFRPEKVTPIEIRLHDLCSSLERSFPTAEIEAMKRMQVLVLVLDGFADPSPETALQRFREILGELVLEDLAGVERRLERAVREPLEASERDALEAARETLEAERPVRSAELAPPARKALRSYALLTDRPLITVLNTAEARASKPVPPELEHAATNCGIPVLSICAALEAEMADLDPQDQPALLAEYGIGAPAGGELTRAVLSINDIVPFFTVGEDECRAWGIPRGTRARSAAGRIHSDIERGFIRAEVIPFDDLLPLQGGLVEARKLGLLRLEGKDYQVQDGDVVHFRFNV